ncbi:MAG: hypothetical protein GF398_09385 [Chitinivibrionales bacterium]|nr:hypothetical protein [Chitinivibrionales bacterium]
MKLRLTWLTCLFLAMRTAAAEPPVGFQGALWGMSSAEVRTTVNPQSWQNVAVDDKFPPELGITMYSAPADIAGNQATVTYYFVEDRFFQATAKFDFSSLENFDFNYNVFRSVDSYYRAIKAQTLTFVRDIYDLLRKKYGKKQPVFRGLDPRNIFIKLDRYLQQERWNLRYNPSEYYKRIVTAAYARWDFPKTRVIFSISISAPDKRFDYTLSLTSLDFERYVNKKNDRLRMKNL